MIRIAEPSDNEPLLVLTASNPMQGSISLRIDRKPDFFSLLEARGKSITYVLEKNSRIIGSFSASKNKVFVNKQATDLYYLSDLKIDNAFRSQVYAFKLVSQMQHYLQSQGADLLFCTVADGNNRVLPVFEGRAALPVFHILGKFSVYQFLPARKPVKNSTYQICQQAFDADLLKQFNQFYQQYQLGKILCADPVQSQAVLVAYIQKQPVAAITLIDTLPYKQNVIIGLKPYLKMLVYTVNSLGKVLPLFPLPEIGEAIKILYINNFYCLKGQEAALLDLVNQARHQAFTGNFHFVSIGLHEKDPLLSCFKQFYKFEFKSVGYITSLKNNTALLNEIMAGVPFEDYSLV
ncbi:GNAT family N-acetyltransferase [Rhodocytophaga rosea]|uniref:GNAT family N-acetyltransferase n=1 Tax=Rhodocytophaga rosea TaxID=2704465 RepID=A0A6C0GE27_9BACT|nr:GNAT family N-acetyltransferase [Rhodocytophaga rosea]QHT65940.1 GNAT family N-acetyltransferase [Rhodocytophaga rosea]